MQEYGWVHLSAGDLLREELKSRPESELGRSIAATMVSGGIVQAAGTVGLLRAAIEAQVAKGNTQFLVDGFPRNAENLEAWKNMARASSGGQANGKNSIEVLFVLFFDCSEAVMLQRLLKRGESSGRSDDNAEAISKRFVTYTEQSQPIIQKYAATSRAHRIDADRTHQQVWEDVKAIFSKIDRDTKPLPKIPVAGAAPV